MVLISDCNDTQGVWVAARPLVPRHAILLHELFHVVLRTRERRPRITVFAIYT